MNQTTNAKPKWFARVEKMVNDRLVNPIAPFGAALVAGACQQKPAKCNTCTSNEVLELALI